MNVNIFFKFGLPILIVLGMMPQLMAENGIYQIGFGAKSKAMGGAAVAYAQDTFGAMANPAGLVDVGSRFDGALGYVYHTQKIAISNIPPAFFPGLPPQTYPINGSKNAVFGEAGYSRRFNDCWTGAILVTPQAGGINKVQKPRPRTPVGVSPFLTEEKERVFYAAITPCIAFHPNCGCLRGHSFGLGVDFTGAAVKFNNFKELALNNPEILTATAHPNHVTDKGWDYGWGAAARLGWLWHVNPCFSLGVSYRTKTFMSRFKRYEGLITPQGRSDLPAVLSAGFGWRFFPSTVIAFDYSRIYFHDAKSFGNRVAQFSVNLATFVATVTNPHGANGGAAFGWKSRDVYKVGISQDFGKCITLRAGYNYSKSPIPKVGTLDSTFLPLTVEHHVTAGGTWYFSPRGELSVSYIHGFKNKIRGHYPPVTPPAAEALVGLGKFTGVITSQIDQIEIEMSWVY